MDRHEYIPDAMAQGDCRLCGNVYDADVHKPMLLDTGTASKILKASAQANAVAEEATRRVVELMQEGIEYRDRIEALEGSLRAIIERWDTPLWKEAEPTGAVISRARAILTKSET